jgi:hypothetical protein
MRSSEAVARAAKRKRRSRSGNTSLASPGMTALAATKGPLP